MKQQSSDHPHGLDISVITVPHNQQQYDTVGNWSIENEMDWVVSVSRMSDWRHEFLVAVHEIIEMGLCKHAGVTTDEVTRFDSQFQGEGEPGDDPKAPYVKQHNIATAVERILAGMLDIKWTEYEDAIRKLA